MGTGNEFNHRRSESERDTEEEKEIKLVKDRLNRENGKWKKN